MNLRITEEEFWRAAKETRLGDQSLEAVYDVLVLGKKRQDVAKRLDISTARLSFMIGRIKAAYLEIWGAPPDWEPVTVALPKALASSIKTLSQKMAEKYVKGQDLDQVIVIKKPTCILTFEARCTKVKKKG